VEPEPAAALDAAGRADGGLRGNISQRDVIGQVRQRMRKFRDIR